MALSFQNFKSKLIKAFDQKAEKQNLTLCLELAPLALVGSSSEETEGKIHKARRKIT